MSQIYTGCLTYIRSLNSPSNPVEVITHHESKCLVNSGKCFTEIHRCKELLKDMLTIVYVLLDHNYRTHVMVRGGEKGGKLSFTRP